MAIEKQDSNIVGVFKTREATYGVTPDNATWQTRSPTSMSDMGGQYSKTDGRVFSPSRQRRKGSVVDMDATGGFSEFLAYDNLWATEFEEFFFAVERKAAVSPDVYPVSGDRTYSVNVGQSSITANNHGFVLGQGPVRFSAATTLPEGLEANKDYWIIPVDSDTFRVGISYASAMASTYIQITSEGEGALVYRQTAAVAGSTSTVTVRNVPSSVSAGTLVLMSGFAQAANNGVKVVTSVSNPHFVVSETLVDEARPPAGATVTPIGRHLPTSDVSMVTNTSGGKVIGFSLFSESAGFLHFKPVPGSWVYIGGDAAGTFFTDSNGNRIGGYARIAVNGVTLDHKTITFDKATFTPVNNAGTGKNIEVFFSDVIKNESDPDHIIRFSSTIERTLGRDDAGIQSEFLTGCVANELTVNGELASEITVDLGYIAQKAGTRTGTEGPLVRRAGNTILPSFSDVAYNTTSNLFRVRLGLVDPSDMAPSPLFARLENWSLTINNNVTAAKAQGVLGGFDVNVGNFDVDGELSAYFSTVDAIHAVKCNWDVTLDVILAKQNKGFYIDVPLIGLGGGQLDIQMDQAIKLPLEAAAAESPFGHTALIGRFAYLPHVAMPDQDC